MMVMLFFAAFACVPRRKSTDDVEFKGMLSRVVGPRDVCMGFFCFRTIMLADWCAYLHCVHNTSNLALGSWM
jgi:hypothetical protein